MRNDKISEKNLFFHVNDRKFILYIFCDDGFPTLSRGSTEPEESDFAICRPEVAASGQVGLRPEKII